VRCLLLLFFETAFGICIGCNVCNLFNREQARLCPGGACELSREARTGPDMVQAAAMLRRGRRDDVLLCRTREAGSFRAVGRGTPGADRHRPGQCRTLQSAGLRQGHGPRREVETP